MQPLFFEPKKNMNNTIPNYDKLENLEICASIDGIDKTYEWIRGYKFDQVDFYLLN